MDATHRPQDAACGARRIALLFSGGLDTTLEVVDRLQTYDEAHLLTFDNGCCINLRAAERRARELDVHVGHGRIRHSCVNTRDLLRRLLAESKRQDDARPASPLLFDLACKMAGFVELIRYARDHGVRDVSDGAAVEQTQVFLQHPVFAERLAAFAAEYGLRFLHPVRFAESRAAKMEALRQLGLRSGPAWLESLHITSQLRHQPFCLRGCITFFFTSPLNRLGAVRRRALSLDRAGSVWEKLTAMARASLAAAERGGLHGRNG